MQETSSYSHCYCFLHPKHLRLFSNSHVIHVQLTSNVLQIGLLNFTVFGKKNLAIGIHGHSRLFSAKLQWMKNNDNQFLEEKENWVTTILFQTKINVTISSLMGSMTQEYIKGRKLTKSGLRLCTRKKKQTSTVYFARSITDLNQDTSFIIAQSYIVRSLQHGHAPSSLQTIVKGTLQAVRVGLPNANSTYTRKKITQHDTVVILYKQFWHFSISKKAQLTAIKTTEQPIRLIYFYINYLLIFYTKQAVKSHTSSRPRI